MNPEFILLFFAKILPMVMEDLGVLKALETAAEKNGDLEVKKLLRQLIIQQIGQSEGQLK